MRARVDKVVTVTDPQIIDAMAFLFEQMKLVVEPSGASALAALLASTLNVRGLRVGVGLSGGNVGRERFCALVGEARNL
jgi:threonine dehydratase